MSKNNQHRLKSIEENLEKILELSEHLISQTTHSEKKPEQVADSTEKKPVDTPIEA
jgi:hypothetical protein